MRRLVAITIFTALVAGHASGLACVWSCAQTGPRPPETSHHHCGSESAPSSKIGAASACFEHDRILVTSPIRPANASSSFVLADVYRPASVEHWVSAPIVSELTGSGPPGKSSINILRI